MATESEYLQGLTALVEQISDPSEPTGARIAATNIARTYLEAIASHLVAQARLEGASWLEIADLFATTEQNVRARFGSLRQYPEDAE